MPIDTGGLGNSTTLLVVLALQASCGRALNVVGSSPTGHPKETSPCKSSTYRGFAFLAPQFLMEH